MMEQAGIVEQSDGKDFKARIFGKWKENGDEGPLGPSCPSRPPPPVRGHGETGE